MKWPLYLRVLKESNLVPLNLWNFGKVPKQRHYNQKNLRLSLETWAVEMLLVTGAGLGSGGE